MLDTINLSISVNPTSVEEEIITAEQGFNILYSQSTRMPNCDIISCDNINLKLGLRLSYPRYFTDTNAYLILTEDQCKAVHEGFVNNLLTFVDVTTEEQETLREWFIKNVTISITRVDIPFTYYIGTDETFNSYYNVYKVVSEVFMIKNGKAVPKDIGVFTTGEVETLILADTKNVGAYNKKVTIYNQARKMEDYYSNKPEIYNSIREQFPDLDSRMRIEVSQRIRRKSMNLIEFAKFNIYKEYVVKFAQYALDNLFDESAVEAVYVKYTQYLAEQLQLKREKAGFTYQNFVLEHLDYIIDYGIIRNAVFIITDNNNSKYSASSTVKAVLENIEEETGIIYMNTLAHIKDISDFLQDIIRGER